MATPPMQGVSAKSPDAGRFPGWRGWRVASPNGPAGASRVVAFGSLVDLARLRTGALQAEICDACNTINKGSARYCKGCSHKLPAFYAERGDSSQDGGDSGNGNGSGGAGAARRPASPGMPGRAFAMPSAAFSVVINLLVVITAPFMPTR